MFQLRRYRFFAMNELFDLPSKKEIRTVLPSGAFADCVSTNAGSGTYALGQQGIYFKPTECSPQTRFAYFRPCKDQRA
jgi:hypothetical protein